MTRTPLYVTSARATVAMGAVGAIVGGAVAAARNYDKVKTKELSREAAVKDVLKETGTTGLATATATALVSALGFTGLLSLAGIVVVTAGAKHLADKALAGKSPCKALPPAETEETPEPKESGKKAKATPAK